MWILESRGRERRVFPGFKMPLVASVFSDDKENSFFRDGKNEQIVMKVEAGCERASRICLHHTTVSDDPANRRALRCREDRASEGFLAQGRSWSNSDPRRTRFDMASLLWCDVSVTWLARAW